MVEQLCRVGLSFSNVMGIFSSNETSEESDFKYHISMNVGSRNVFLFIVYSFTKFDILGLLTDKLTMHVFTTSRPATKWKFWPPRQKSAGRSPLSRFLMPLATAAMWPWITLIYFDAKIISKCGLMHLTPYNK